MAGHPIFFEVRPYFVHATEQMTNFFWVNLIQWRHSTQVRNEFYKDTQGALLVYDVSDRHSFESLELWLNEMKQEIGNQVEVDNIVFAVCANKVVDWTALKHNTSQN